MHGLSTEGAMTGVKKMLTLYVLDRFDKDSCCGRERVEGRAGLIRAAGSAKMLCGKYPTVPTDATPSW